MMLSSEKLATFELCPRRYVWQNRYGMLRVSLMGAIYRALDAGLRGDNPERAAENQMLSLAANPGLDVTGQDVYQVAMHYAKLAGIISVALRSASTAPWSAWPDEEVGNPSHGLHGWRSACYDAGDGLPRRVVLVDRWSDDRKAQEMRGWRSLGETCALRKRLMLTAVTIGASHDKRRYSPWTRCYQHPRNRLFRFKRTTSTEDFGSTWTTLRREDSDVPTVKWLDRMRDDGCMGDLIHTETVPVPARWQAYVREMQRMAGEIERWEERLGETPPLRLAGCYGFSPCVFLPVCHGSNPPIPENYGFRIIQPKV